MKKALITLIIIIILSPIILVFIHKEVDKYIEKESKNSIEEYILAQGLENEEILEDSGYAHFLSTERTIVFAKNPEIKYNYSAGDFIFHDIDYYFNPFKRLKDRYNVKDRNYKGVSFNHSKDIVDNGYEIEEHYYDEDMEDGVLEGKVDINGKLIKEIPWK